MAPGFGWCAWCGEVIEGELVDDHGVSDHAGCYARRRAVLAPERDRLEDIARLAE